MTAQLLALRYVTSWTLQASAAALKEISARWGRHLLAAIDNIHHRDDQRCLSAGSFRRIEHAPGGIFDPLFIGISTDAAGISTAICRHPHLRRFL